MNGAHSQPQKATLGDNPSSAKNSISPRFLRSEVEPANVEIQLNESPLENVKLPTSILGRSSMKRKLNDEQVPSPVEPDPVPQGNTTFVSFGLDARLLQAIAQENFSSPTLVQAKAIPLILDGKDVLGQQCLLSQ